MKKLFILFAFLFAVSTFAATYKFPGWKCTDVAKIDAAIAVSPTAYSTFSLQCLKRLALKAPESFDDILAVVAAETKNIPQESARKNFEIHMSKKLSVVRGEFVKAAFAWSKTHPDRYDIFFYLNRAEELNFSDTEVYSGILENLLSYDYGVKIVKRSVEKLVDVSCSVKVTTQKADFQRLNRKYSKNLLKDKATWEPVVALIRTMIDTY